MLLELLLRGRRSTHSLGHLPTQFTVTLTLTQLSPRSLTQLSSRNPAYTTFTHTPQLTQLNLHHSTHTTQLAKFNSHNSTFTKLNLHNCTHTTQLTQLNSHNPTATTQHTQLNAHNSTYTTSLTPLNRTIEFTQLKLHKSARKIQLTQLNTHKAQLAQLHLRNSTDTSLITPTQLTQLHSHNPTYTAPFKPCNCITGSLRLCPFLCKFATKFDHGLPETESLTCGVVRSYSPTGW